MALSLQQEQQSQEINWEQAPEGISDLELAKKLQEEEDRRASQYYQEQEQAAAAAAAASTSASAQAQVKTRVLILKHNDHFNNKEICTEINIFKLYIDCNYVSILAPISFYNIILFL